MGFLDFLFKPKVELPDQEPLWESSEPVWERPKVTLEKTRQYSDKGITKRSKKKSDSKWIAQISFRLREGKPTTIYVGTYNTKEEAQKARWEFIENLK